MKFYKKSKNKKQGYPLGGFFKKKKNQDIPSRINFKSPPWKILKSFGKIMKNPRWFVGKIHKK